MTHFDGATYSPQHDRARLGSQLARVQDAMRDGSWRTLSDLCVLAACTTASASARIRDLRKDRNGGWQIERERIEGGLFRYRRVLPVEQATALLFPTDQQFRI